MEGKKKGSLSIISFTERGYILSHRLKHFLLEEGFFIEEAVKAGRVEGSMKEELSTWLEQRFDKREGILFIGATGIAVRSIAPLLRGKDVDPGVLVLDEQGRFVIPLLSGHLGGANALARKISRAFGSHLVLTTATDINGKWAVDLFAKKNRLWISNLKLAKEVSAKILSGEVVSIQVEEGGETVGDGFPKEVRFLKEGRPDIYIGLKQAFPQEEVLHLVPRELVVGVGCRKGCETEKIAQGIQGALEKAHLWKEGIKKICSFDWKKSETGILECCKDMEVEFMTFPKEVLQEISGSTASSPFVQRITGIDNVCERSALAGVEAEEKKLWIPKQVGEGMTVAVAAGNWRIEFETEK